MLSWNYWVSDGFILAASPDGRPKGKFLSNAICPSNGADIFGPTANVNSVGKVIGGKSNQGDWHEFVNLLPNGSSHTMTFNPSLIRDEEHKEKFKSFLKSYTENGGTALQINIIDADMLRDAQKNPQNYRHLLVRVTGYNAYFTTIGKELQDEIILRKSHCMSNPQPMSETVTLLHYQRLSTEDGPGIRTTAFERLPVKLLPGAITRKVSKCSRKFNGLKTAVWVLNLYRNLPAAGTDPGKQLLAVNRNLCLGCGECAAVYTPGECVGNLRARSYT